MSTHNIYFHLRHKKNINSFCVKNLDDAIKIPITALRRFSFCFQQRTRSDEHGSTCDCPTNSYVDKNSLKLYPDGKRIDYIFYRTNKGTLN